MFSSDLTQPSIPDILESTRTVLDTARHVRIDVDAVTILAGRLCDDPRLAEAPDEALGFDGTPEQCANFVLLMDALNFCFWSDEPWVVEHRGRQWTRTHAMVAGLLRAVESDRTWLEADRWDATRPADVEMLFAGVSGRIPLFSKRLDIIRETGAILRDRFDGSFLNAVEDACFDARRLALLLAEGFPSFRDVAEYGGRPVAFLKRAQICAADLHRLWFRHGMSRLTGLEALTLFADYRLPQILRHTGVFQLDPALAERIDREELIEAGSPEEVELRAATIQAGTRLVDALTQAGRPTPAWRLDYVLWLMSKEPDVSGPHHRTLTIYY